VLDLTTGALEMIGECSAASAETEERAA